MSRKKKPMTKQFLEAGKIVGVHGIQGAVKVQSWCDTPQTLCELETLYWDDRTPVTVEQASVHKNIVLLRLAGISTPEQAETLRGRILYLNRDDVTLPDNLVFIQDILGFPVYDCRTDTEVGVLQDVLTENPAYDLYEILRPDQKKVYVPASAPFLKEINMETKIIYIESIEGLLE